MMRVLIVGAGGVGSQMADLLVPALSAGRLSEKVGGIQLHMMDDDRVEVENLFHQRHEPRMVGRTKVESLAERVNPYLSKSLTFTPHPLRLEEPRQLSDYDLVVVAVDRPEARKLVHDNCENWLDLRCSGDGMVALDDESDSVMVAGMTPLDAAPASCQIPGSIEAGNVQMGYAMAAAHGSQWVIQRLRKSAGLPYRPTPSRMYSLTFGPLNFPDSQPQVSEVISELKSNENNATSTNSDDRCATTEEGGVL